ncbi:FAD-binding domain-containing protein [Venturia nashicola]|nr:FAD-binding domain-containing protein [Venturia nashicola]
MRSLSSLVSFSFLLANVCTQQVPATGQCKVIPGSAQWPSEADWAGLSTAVQGRLLKPSPPASRCHQGQANYSPEGCAEVTENWKKSEFHANDPISSMWQNYNNYSCMPDAAGSCSGAGYPVYVVAAKTGSDVQAAVNFARTKGVRLNIKATGHDYAGRSVQPNSLSIWTHGMKEKKFTNSFVPEGCKSAIPGTVITVGSGSQWGDVSKEVKARELMVVAGAHTTVSVGGFFSNGGHGALSAKYGLGADMVAEIELVTAAGELIKANECQNEDYFWAMRGGGGSTYGVAVSYTIQTIPSVPTARWAGSLANWDQLTYMHAQWPRLAAAGVSGYMNGYPGRNDGRTSISLTMPNSTDRRALEALLNPILEAMGKDAIGEGSRPSGGSGGRGGRDSDEDDNSRRALDRFFRRRHNKRSPKIVGEYSHYATWAEAEKHHIGSHDAGAHERRDMRNPENADVTFPGTGSNKIVTSWLWSSEDCANPALRTALRGAFDTDTQLLNDMTMGSGTWAPPYLRGGSNAVNPAFRTATMRPAAELQWAGTSPALLEKKKADALKFGASLRSLSPNGGTYANEADPDSPGWQQAFWGSNYERLLSIKKKVDPEGVFYCRACVGSEMFEDVDGVLCRK